MGAHQSLVGVRINNLIKVFLEGKALFLGGMPPFFGKVVHCTTFFVVQCTTFFFRCAKHYAQINAFFQIQVGDNALDGLIVASVTSRNYQQNTKYNLVKIESQRSLNSNILFVSIKDIYPTRIATIPFAKNGIVINIRRSNVLKCKYSASHLYSLLVELYMFTLHPERLTFRMD
jgi:hypothetical protein